MLQEAIDREEEQLLSARRAQSHSIASDLRSIGLIPRVFAIVVTVIAVALSWAGFQASGSLAISFILVPPSIVVLALSCRVRARLVDAELVVRSYVRTCRVPLASVLYFAHVPYSGFWNRSGGMELKSRLSVRMIDVTRIDHSGYFLPATMCTRDRCERIVQELNVLVDDVKGSASHPT